MPEKPMAPMHTELPTAARNRARVARIRRIGNWGVLIPASPLAKLEGSGYRSRREAQAVRKPAARVGRAFALVQIV